MPSRRKEKNLERCSTVHHWPPLDLRARRPRASRSRASCGRSASQRGATPDGGALTKRAGRHDRASAPKARSTSSPTSKRRGPMHGPSQAQHLRRVRSRAASHSAASDASTTPAASPRQPACAAATARPAGAANSTGRQSATCTMQATPGSVGPRWHRPQAGCARGRSRHGPAPPCSHAPGAATPAARRVKATKRRRFSATAAGSSPTAAPRFRLSHGAALTPPLRVLITAPTLAAASHCGHSTSAASAAGGSERIRAGFGPGLLERVELHAGRRTRASPAARGRAGSRSAAR